MVGQIDWIFSGFDACIVKTPEEGLMGLTRDGKPIVLNNGDMISLNLLDKRYASLLYAKGMLTPIKMPNKIKPRDNRYNKLKVKGRSRKKRAKNNARLDSWVFEKVNGFRR